MVEVITGSRGGGEKEKVERPKWRGGEDDVVGMDADQPKLEYEVRYNRNMEQRVKELEDQLNAVQEEVGSAEERIQTVEEDTRMLWKMQSLSAPASKSAPQPEPRSEPQSVVTEPASKSAPQPESRSEAQSVVTEPQPCYWHQNNPRGKHDDP
ncbi:hypothetical protein N9L68_05775 [bacterium]|nr:hypothetical protein [bacterium]